LDPPPWRSADGNPGGFLAITDAVNSQSTVIVFPDIDTGKVVTSFTFAADLRIGNGTGNAGRPADGFSINYARSNDPVIVNNGASLNDFAVAGGPENGTSTGIAISFDTWQGNTLPDGGDIEGIIVRVDNKTVLRQAMPTRNGTCTDVTSIQTGPYDGQDTGDRTGLCWAKVEVTLDPAAKLTVKYKGNTILNAYQTTYFPSPGRLVLAGRTGGANENTDIDNIQITTVASSDTAPPSAPGAITVTTTTAGKVVLNWGAATDDSGRVAYNLQRDGTVIGQFLGGTTYNDLNVVPGTTYSYQVQAVDATGNKSAFTTAVTASTLAAKPVETHGLTFEAWFNIPNAVISALTDDPRFQTNAPDFRALTTSFDTRPVFSTDAHENYGGRLSGLLVPKDTGDYTFFLRSDDASQLFLSTDATTNNLALVAEETGCCQAFLEPDTSATGWHDNGAGLGQTTLTPIHLVGGQKYAVQVLWKEGGGGDYAQVAWRKAGDTNAAASLKPISGDFLLTQWDPTVGQPVLTTVPTNGVISLGSNGALTAAAAIGDQPITFQWTYIGTNIVNATNATLNLNNFGMNNIGLYSVTASNVVGTVSATAVLLPKNALFVEAEDFNFGHGQYVTNQPIGMTGPYRGDAYRGIGSADDALFDWNADHGGAQNYRFDAGPDADKENQHPDGLPRGTFDVQVNNVVGWNDAGEWYDYTRRFPTPAQDYNVIGRLASGGDPIHVRMDEITAGLTTTNQTLSKVGEFRPGRATAGWDNMEFFPLVDDAGQPAVLKGWTGLKSFRMTMVTNSAEDMDYFMFVPVGGTNTGGGNTNVFTSAVKSANNLVLTWSTGTLEQADSVDGPWTPVANTPSPATIPITGTRKFYRLR